MRRGTTLPTGVFMIAFCVSGLLAGEENTRPPERFDFVHVSVEDGLSQGTVNAILQDRDGFLWFGTEDGLNRYDGYTFKVYKNDPDDPKSLSNSFIWSLCQDQDGGIWIATDGGGLNYLDPAAGRFVRYRNVPEDSSSLSDDNVQVVFVDRSNTLWVGTWGGGLNRFDRESGTFIRYPVEAKGDAGLRNAAVWTVYEDSDGFIWVGTDGGGVSRLDRRTGVFRHVLSDSGDQQRLSHDAVTSILEDSHGDLWFGTYGGGLNRLIGGLAGLSSARFVHYLHDPARPLSLPEDIIWKVFEDSRGVLWVATLSQGLAVFDRKRDQFIAVRHDPADPGSLSNNYVRSLFEDQSGVLWVGTMVGGLNKLDRKPQKFLHLSHQGDDSDGLPNDFVFAVCEDGMGKIWIGTYGGGLSRYDPVKNRFTHFRHNPDDPHSLSSDQVRVIFEDSRGTLWVGTYFGGLNRYEPSINGFVRYRETAKGEAGLSHDNIRAIFEDRQETLWIGTNGGGLNRFVRDREQFIHYRFEPDDPHSLSNDNILSIAEDADGCLWVGTYAGGLNRLDVGRKTFTRYKHVPDDSRSLSNNVVTDLFVDHQGQLWIASWGGGLNKYVPDLDGFIHYGEKDGLASNVVYSILEDAAGYLWLACGRHLTRFDSERHLFRNYDFRDGLQKEEFNPGARCRGQNGWLYFGGVGGIDFFDPARVHDNPHVPPVVLTSLRVFDQPVPLRGSPSHPGNLALSYKDRLISFEFAALDFTNPARNQYAYRLEGFDEDWIEAGTRRYASYTNLQPGGYTFRVRASNNDGLWNEEGLSIRIAIAPPFWRKWWFRLVAAVTFGGVLFVAFHLRTRNLRKAKAAQENFSRKLIEMQEQERKRIASELHDSLGQDLLILNNGIQQCAQALPKTSKTVKELRQLSGMALHSIEEVREIASNLHPHQLDRLGLKKALESMLAHFARTASFTLTVQIEDVDGLLGKEQEINIYRVIQEAMNNILKHASATTAEVRFTRGVSRVQLAIHDDGKGFEMDNKRDTSASLSGFGLANLRERVRIMGGKLHIDSAPGRGTKMDITIPVHEA